MLCSCVIFAGGLMLGVGLAERKRGKEEEAL